MNVQASTRFTPSHRLIGVVLLSILVTSQWMGCADQDFDPKSLLSGYRMIAIKAEPPQLSAVTPVQIKVMDYHPNDLESTRPNLSYRWKLCPFTLGSPVRYECFVNELTLEETGPEITLNFASLLEQLSAEGELMDFMQQATESAAIITGMDVEPPSTFELYLKLSILDGDRSIFESVKRLPVLLDPTAQVNQNPKLFALRQYPQLTTYPVGTTVKIEAVTQEGSAELIPLDDTVMRAPVSGGVSESTEGQMNEALIPSPPLPPNSMDRPNPPDGFTREQLVFTWLVSSGKLEEEVGFADQIETTLTLPDEPGPVRLFLTVRDGRGGVDVQSVDLVVSESSETP